MLRIHVLASCPASHAMEQCFSPNAWDSMVAGMSGALSILYALDRYREAWWTTHDSQKSKCGYRQKLQMAMGAAGWHFGRHQSTGLHAIRDEGLLVTGPWQIIDSGRRKTGGREGAAVAASVATTASLRSALKAASASSRRLPETVAAASFIVPLSPPDC